LFAAPTSPNAVEVSEAYGDIGTFPGTSVLRVVDSALCGVSNLIEPVCVVGSDMVEEVREVVEDVRDGLDDVKEAVEESREDLVLFWGTGALVCCLFAGLMSGLTLGILSLSVVELEILARSGTELEKSQVQAVFPLVKKGHQLLVTLLLCNSLAMEGLPLCLDQIVSPLQAVVLSVTMVLIFGEIVPQATGSKYGLEIGAASAPFVEFLMKICSPIAYPISLLLDDILGEDHMALFRRSELSVLMDLEMERGELSQDECLIISGAMSLVDKRVRRCYIPLEETFLLSQDAVLDDATVTAITEAGYARLPVHSPGRPSHVLGILSIKNLIVLNPHDATPLSMMPLFPVQTVSLDAPLHEVLNMLQSSGVHMALVTDDASPGGGTVGIITLSSVLEELLQEKIAHQTRATGDQYTQYVNDVAKARAYTTFIVDKKKVLRDDIYKSMDDGESGGVENYNGRVR